MRITEYSFNASIKRDIKAAFVADTHDIKYDKLLYEIKARNVDLILCTGDIIFGHDAVIKNGLDMLSAFARTAPTFMSLGNHESGAVDLVKLHCINVGVSLLDDRYTAFEDVIIGGLTSGYISDKNGIKENHWRKTPRPNLSFLDEYSSLAGYKILLSHHPEYYPEYLVQRDIDLILSGHAHGGQWRLGSQGLFAPGQGIFPKYTSGIHDNRLIVSRGLANNAFVPRLFNPCELIFIDLISISSNP